MANERSVVIDERLLDPKNEAEIAENMNRILGMIDDFEKPDIKLIDGIKLGCTTIREIPSNVKIDTSEVTNFDELFKNSGLRNAPYIDTSNATRMVSMFDTNFNLKEVPVYDTSKVISFNKCFKSCTALSNDALNNIMQMCINATSYNGTKTLKTLGLDSSQATKCQSLSNYEAFIEAGWTTGYEE